MNDEERTPLLKNQSDVSHIPAQETFLWMIFHWSGFFVGGSTFVVGSTLYFFPDLMYSAEISATLYTIGSIGFLSVDVIEFFTFTEIQIIRINIACSMIGSTLYVIGSIGFFPAVYNVTDTIGIWGFILGSFFIGSSQLWKTHRIGTDKDGSFSFANLLKDNDNFTQVGVELNAGIGAWCFFFGTVMYLHGPLEGSFYAAIISIWIAGSCFFLAGSLFLGYRHWVMRV